MLTVMFPEIECLVLVMAHNFAHREQENEDERKADCEGTACGYALATLQCITYGSVQYDPLVPAALNKSKIDFIKSIVSVICCPNYATTFVTTV